jgi:mono/diheme cytochrome c family protein
MLLNLLILALLIILAFIFFTFFRAGARQRKWWVKWSVILVTGLLTLVVVALVFVALVGIGVSNMARANAAQDVKVEATPEMVARGEQLAWLCVDCHSSTGELPLNGGTQNLLPTNMPLGEVYGTNLTPGGPLAKWTDGQIIRAIREGVNNEGRPLFTMPSMAFHSMSDADVQALVAYLRSQPALRHDQRPRQASFLSLLLVGLGIAPTSVQAPITGPVEAPPRGPTAEYGHYLIGLAGCQDCHGAALNGVPANQFIPAGPDLRVRVPGWTPEQFIALFRTGALPEGRTASPVMPWQITGKAMGDDDLRAMHAYIRGQSD